MKAFWFSADNNLPMHKLQKVGEEAQGPAAEGVMHLFKGDLKIMADGLHWAENLITAIRFSGGPICWEVEVGGKILTCGGDVHHPEQQHPDSMYTTWGCAEQRTYLKRTDFQPLISNALERIRGTLSECKTEISPLLGNYIYMLYEQAQSAQSVKMQWGAAQMALWECMRALEHAGLSWRDAEEALQAAYRGEDYGT